MNLTGSKHKIWWLWLPLFFIIGEFMFERIAPENIVSWSVSENGPVEIFQFLIAAAACMLAAMTFFQVDYKTDPLPKIAMALGALGCFYIAGEEVSWGQWFIGWTTPAEWMAVNDQGETNLHNTSNWFDQKPRLILEIGVVVGGLILPFLIRKKPSLIPAWLKTLTPPARFGVLAGIYLYLRLVDAVGSGLHGNPYFRSSEIIEIVLFYFMLLYVFYIRERTLKRA